MHVSKSNVCRSLHTQALRGHENEVLLEGPSCTSRYNDLLLLFLKILMSIWGFRIYVHIHYVKI